MPFDLDATTHVFSKTPTGSTQRVIARDVSHDHQVRLVREHLNAIRTDFLKRDFTAPARIHGSDMPGLAPLRSAQPDQVTIRYRDVPGGTALDYRSDDAKLIEALHAWFDAQLSDHGKDATAGHHRHHRHHRHQDGSRH